MPGADHNQPRPDPATALAQGGHAPTLQHLEALAGSSAYIELHDLHVGYGKMEVIHGIDLRLGRGQSLCLIGPNGAGKSTILRAMFGLADVLNGHILIGGRNVTKASAETMLTAAKVAYVLQTSSVFPDMTVAENLFIGGHVLLTRREAAAAAERIFDSHPQLASRRNEPAGTLSGGERRMLELWRALITDPDILLIDEPSIGLEPRAIDAVFELLDRLQRGQGKTIVIVEQNVKKGLEFADLGYVLVSGRVALADQASRVLQDQRIGRFFLGG